MRKLYKEVRSDLKTTWGFINAIQLSIGTSNLVKDDRKIRDVGIYDNITMTVIALSAPDKWDIFVTVPEMSLPAKITLEEVLYLLCTYVIIVNFVKFVNVRTM